MTSNWKSPLTATLTIVFLVGLAACSLGGDSTSQEPPIAWAEGNCTEADPHPIGENIALTYDVPYDQVMVWYCSGYSFENILIALETSAAVDIPAETLLQMLLEKDWETIWDEVGFAGDQ